MLRDRLRRGLAVAFVFLGVCIALTALVSCSANLEEQAGLSTEYGTETTEAERVEEGEIGVEGGQSEPGPSEPMATVDLDTARQQVREGGGGFWSYLQAPGAVGDQTYRVDPGEDFTAAFTIGNYQGDPLDLAFTCLVDFAQTACVEGEVEKVHQVELGAQEDRTLQLRVASLSEGLHDVVFAIFMYPDEHSTDWRFRADTRFMYYCDRVTVYAGESRATPRLDTVGFAEPDELASQGMHGYAISKRGGEEWEEAWHLEETSPGGAVEYYITRNNPEDRAITYAFLGFLDYEQVPIGADHVVLYAEVEAHARATARGEFSAPSQPGEHEFFVLAVDNPYLDQAEEFTAPNPRWADTYTSDRVLIRVQ